MEIKSIVFLYANTGCFQLKIGFQFKIFYFSFRVTTKEKPIVDKIDYDKGVKAYHHKGPQITKEDSKKQGTKDPQESENNKIVIVRPYLSIITLKQMGSILHKRHRMADE